MNDYKPAVLLDKNGDRVDLCSPREVLEVCMQALYFHGPLDAASLRQKLLGRRIDCPEETITRFMEEAIASLPDYRKPFAIASGFTSRTYKHFSLCI